MNLFLSNSNERTTTNQPMCTALSLITASALSGCGGGMEIQVSQATLERHQAKHAVLQANVPAKESPQAVVPPSSGAPVVFNATVSGRAGNVVSLQGENFGPTPEVWLDGTGGAAPTKLNVVNKVGTVWLGVDIPPSATGALIVRIANGSARSAPVKLNAAQAHHLDALQLVPGGAFRVFGRNLLLPGATPMLKVDGLPANVDLGASDEHMLVATAPMGLQASSKAAISVDNGNGSGAMQLDREIEVTNSGAGDPFQLGVGWAGGFSSFAARVIDVKVDARLASKVACDGQQNDGPAIQAAVALASRNGGAIVQLPAGTCRLASGFQLLPNVVVRGAGKDVTILKYDASPMWGPKTSLSGVMDLTFTNSGLTTEPPTLVNSERVFIKNVKVNLGTAKQMFLSENKNIVVSGVEVIQAGTDGPLVMNGSRGMVFESNSIQFGSGSPSFDGVHDSYISSNTFTRDARFQASTVVTHSMTINFAHRISIVGNNFMVSNGSITNKGRNDGETILSEGGGGNRTENLGTVKTATSLTLSDPSNVLNVDPFKSGAIPENYGIAIAAGKGLGQTRRVIAYSLGTMTIDRPWDSIPDGTSKYSTFVWGLEKSLIKGNNLSNNPRGIWIYHSAARDTDIVGNTLSEGGGIYLKTFQDLSAKSFMPAYNVIIEKNKISNTTRNWTSGVATVFSNWDSKAFGSAMIGIEVRENEIKANIPNLRLQNTEELAGEEGFSNYMRLYRSENYQKMMIARIIGSILERNKCINCDVGFTVGTSAGGTVLTGSKIVNSKALWAEHSAISNELSTDTIVRH